MSSINQIISELAHSLQQPNSVPVRRALRQDIIHVRNSLIRKSDSNHRYTDKGLMQRFRVDLIEVPDGDVAIEDSSGGKYVKRTKNKVPRPVRLTNNLPFHSIRTIGSAYNKKVAFVKESASEYYAHLPGMKNASTYDYINEYVYILSCRDIELSLMEHLIIESVFEYPNIIVTETNEGVLDLSKVNDDDEFLLPEDMIPELKAIVLQGFVPQVVRETNEIPNNNLTK